MYFSSERKNIFQTNLKAKKFRTSQNGEEISEGFSPIKRFKERNKNVKTKTANTDFQKCFAVKQRNRVFFPPSFSRGHLTLRVQFDFSVD